jgi:uncharacterized protein YhdP
MSRSRVTLLVIVALVVVLVAARIALPPVVKGYVNRTLHSMQNYQGSVDDIDIHLWRGAYRINGLKIVKLGGKHPAPFFSTDALDLSVEWQSLIHGRVVAEAEFAHPRLNLVQSDDKQQQQLGDDENWIDKLRELSPMRFNTVRVRDGEVTFRVPAIKVQDALQASQVNGQITNLTNVVERNKDTFSDFDMNARVLDNAPIHVAGSINPFGKQPTFDVNLKLEQVQLPKVNPWLREFIKADAASGQFELYIEMAAADGRFKGYAKPLMQNVKIAHTEEDKGKPLRRIWEGLVSVAVKIFENHHEDQVAARVPFSGSIDNPKVGIFETLVSVLRNAFIGAFSQSLEGSVSLHDVKENLQDIRDDSAGGKQDDKDKKKESDKNEKNSKSNQDQKSSSSASHQKGPK